MGQRLPRHRYYLVFDSAAFQSLPDPHDPRGSPAWDPLHWESFLDRIATAFDGSLITDRRGQWAGGTQASYVAETPRLMVGISQNKPDFVFVVPKCYERKGGAILRPYKIEIEARKGFNRLIRACPELSFTRPNSSGVLQVVSRYTL